MSRGHHTRSFTKGSNRPGGGGGGNTGSFRDALDIEDAAHAFNKINARINREKHEARVAERTKVTLPGGSGLAAWLKKEVP